MAGSLLVPVQGVVGANDLIMQRRAQLDGHYSGADYVTVD